MPDCAYYEELLSARLDGPLSPEEQAALNTHLVSCPHCRDYVQQLQALPLSLLTAAAEPPDHLVGQIMTEVKAASPAAKPKKLSRRWAGLVCAALLALVILNGVPLRFGGIAPEAEESASAAEPAEPAEGAAAGSDSSTGEESTAGTLPESEYAAPDTETAPGPQQSPPAQDFFEDADTQEDALKILEIHLQEQGRIGLNLTPAGLSEDGKSWLFTAETPAATPAALFSVSRTTGEVREMPAAEKIMP